MKKRIMSAAVLLCLFLTLVSCGKGDVYFELAAFGESFRAEIGKCFRTTPASITSGIGMPRRFRRMWTPPSIIMPIVFGAPVIMKRIMRSIR